MATDQSSAVDPARNPDPVPFLYRVAGAAFPGGLTVHREGDGAVRLDVAFNDLAVGSAVLTIEDSQDLVLRVLTRVMDAKARSG